MRKKFPEWYMEKIEEPVRRIVYELRNAGIDTWSSCGHGMWIQCEATDCGGEMTRVMNVMNRLKIRDYRIHIIAGETRRKQYHPVMEIMLLRPDGTYHSCVADTAAMKRLGKISQANGKPTKK